MGAEAPVRADVSAVAFLKEAPQWPLVMWAALTVLTHVAQLTGLPFSSYARLAAILSLGLAVVWTIRLWSLGRRLQRRELGVLFMITLVCVLGSAIAVLINHPADDDYFYLPNAVFALQHPSLPMGFQIHFIFSDAEPLRSTFWATSGPYEYIQAAGAWMLGVSLPALYYTVTVAIIGFMIPLSLCLLLSHFMEDARSGVAGTMIALVCVLLLGETPRTFGSHSLAHPFQGVVVVLSVMLPLFASYALDWLEHASSASWISAFAVAVAAVGASSSAVFLVPALAITLALSAVLAFEHRARILERGLMLSLALVYPVLFGAFIRSQGAADLGAGSPANYGWPADFLGHARFLINPLMPVTPVVFVITTGAGIFLLRGTQRRMLAAWVLCAAALFLNPFVAPLLIQFATSPNAYWRMFYILPFPLTIGIVASVLYSRAGAHAKRWRDAAAILAGFILGAAALSLSEASILLKPQVELGFTKFKIPEQLVQTAQDVIAIAPEGPMLAPSLLGGTVVLFDSDYPQVRIKKDPLRAWLYAQGSMEDAENRIRASDYLDGRPNGDFDSLAWILREHPGIRSIVLRRHVYRRDEVRELLDLHDYTSSKPIEGYIVVWK